MHYKKLLVLDEDPQTHAQTHQYLSYIAIDIINADTILYWAGIEH